MARTAEITFKEFRRRYNTEDACRAELFRLRFPNGFVCPKCGCVENYSVHGRNIYQCRSCRHQTSVTAGTVMHRTHLPLTLWFWAIYLCATDKRGISAVQLSRTLGICYDSARMMYLNSCNIDEANRRRKMEQMKEEIVQDVLSHISATVDVSEIFDAIDGLNEKIESLGTECAADESIQPR